MSWNQAQYSVQVLSDFRSSEQKDNSPMLLNPNRRKGQPLITLAQLAGIKSVESDVPLDFPNNGYHNAFRGPGSGLPMTKSLDLQEAGFFYGP